MPTSSPEWTGRESSLKVGSRALPTEETQDPTCPLGQTPSVESWFVPTASTSSSANSSASATASWRPGRTCPSQTAPIWKGALLAARHRARLDQDRRLFYDRLAERLDAVAVVLSTPMTPKEAARAVATELGLAEEQVLPFVTKIDLLALASRRPGKAAEA